MNWWTGEEFSKLIRSVGTHRDERVLSPAEVARLLSDAKAQAATNGQIAGALGIGTTQVGTFLRLLDLDPSVQDLADWGRGSASTVAFSCLAEISRLDKHDHARAVEAAITFGLSWKEVVQLAQISARTSTTIEEAITSVLNLRPEIEIRHVLVLRVQPESLQRSLRRIEQTRRDEILGVAIQTLGISGVSSARLGPQQIVLVTTESVEDQMRLSADEIEEQLTELVKRGSIS